MGRYVTPQDLERRLPEEELAQLTDDLGVGAVDTTRVEQAIADAEAEVDAYLQARYDLPLAAVPPLVVRLTADLAVWHLVGRRGPPDEGVTERYKAAVRLLEKIAAGQVKLGVESPPAETSGGVQVSKSEADRLFGPDVLDRF